MTEIEYDVELYNADYFHRLPVQSGRIQQILSRIQFEPADRVCEFGSGLGHFLFAVQEKIAYGLGIDSAEYAVRESNRSAVASGVHNLDFRRMNISTLPNMEDWAYGFDKVLMIDVAEHIENDVFMEFLISAKSILNPDGELIIHTPNAGYYIERLKAREVILKQIPGHIAVRHAHHYKPMLATAGFNIKSIVYLPHYKNPMNMIDRKLMNLPIVGSLFRSRLLIVGNPDRTKTPC